MRSREIAWAVGAVFLWASVARSDFVVTPVAQSVQTGGTVDFDNHGDTTFAERSEIRVIASATLDATPRNLAVAGTATASSAGFGSVVADANDGNRDGDFNNGSVWHTTDGNARHWWQVDLGADYYLDRVQVFPRTGAGPHWSDFSITVSNALGHLVFSQSFLSANSVDRNWGTSALRGVRGRTVRIQSNVTPWNTSMAEFEVWGQEAPIPGNTARGAIVSGEAAGFSSALGDIQDGDIDGHFNHAGYPVYHAAAAGAGKTVTVDLGTEIDVDRIMLYARSDAGTRPRLSLVGRDGSGATVQTVTVDLDGTDAGAIRYDSTVPWAGVAAVRYVDLTTLDAEFHCVAEIEILGELPAVQGRDILIQPYPAFSGTLRDNHTGQLGMLFRIPATAPGVTVRALGFYDDGGNGLSQAHEVGIWFTGNNAASGTLLASTVVPPGLKAPLHFGYRWVNLTPPLTLLPQTEGDDWYVLGARVISGSGDAWRDQGGWVGWRHNPLLQEGYNDRRWTGSAWSAIPSASGGANNLYGPANLATVGVPTSGTLFIVR